jgi:catechol 2,3-dioxygenase-like lactoylglutathione lyase family enzyme
MASAGLQWNHANPVLEVSDVPRAIAYYRDVLGLPKTEAWGLRGFTVRDLDGNLIGIAHEVHSPIGRDEYRDLTPQRRGGH